MSTGKRSLMGEHGVQEVHDGQEIKEIYII